MPVNITKYANKIGVFQEEIDLTVPGTPAVEQATIQLVPGFSKQGPVNRPIFLSSEGEARDVFGPIDRSLEANGSYFHRTLINCLQAGPVYGLNLFNYNDDLDNLNFVSLSLKSDLSNDISRYEGISKFYETEVFWKNDKDAVIEAAAGYLNPVPIPVSASPAERALLADYFKSLEIEVPENKYIIHFVNKGQKELTLFITKETPKSLGFDGVTIEEWYTKIAIDADDRIIPPYLDRKSLISDYFIRVYVFEGNWTDYKTLITDRNVKTYFDKTGLLKDKINLFAADSNSNLLNYYDVCLIPYFTDTEGRNWDIETIINSETNLTGLEVAYDTDKLQKSDYPMGLVDLIGNNIVDQNDPVVDFLSYKEKLSENINICPVTLNQPSNMFYLKGDYVVDGTEGRSPGTGIPERVQYYTEWNVYNADNHDKSDFRTHGLYVGGGIASSIDENNLHNATAIKYSDVNAVNQADYSINLELLTDDDAYAVVNGKFLTKEQLTFDGKNQNLLIAPIQFPNLKNYMRVSVIYIDGNGVLGIKHGQTANILKVKMPIPPQNSIIVGFVVSNSELDINNPSDNTTQADTKNAEYRYYCVTFTGRNGIKYRNPEQVDNIKTIGFMEDKFVHVYANVSNMNNIIMEFVGTSKLSEEDPTALGDERGQCCVCGNEQEPSNPFNERLLYYYHWLRTEMYFKKLIAGIKNNGQSVLVGRGVLGTTQYDWQQSERWYKNYINNVQVLSPTPTRNAQIHLPFDAQIINADDSASELTPINNRKVKGTLKNNEGGKSASPITINVDTIAVDRTANYADEQTLAPIAITSSQFNGGTFRIDIKGAKDAEITSPITIKGVGNFKLNQEYQKIGTANKAINTFYGIPYGPYEITVTATINGKSYTESKKVFMGHYNTRIAYLTTRWTAMDNDNPIGNKKPGFVLDFDTPANIARYFPLQALALSSDMTADTNFDGAVIIYAAGGNPVDKTLAPDPTTWNPELDWNPKSTTLPQPNPNDVSYRFVIDDMGKWTTPPSKPYPVGDFNGVYSLSPYFFRGLKDLEYNIIAGDRFGFSDDVTMKTTINKPNTQNQGGIKVWARDFTIYFFDNEFVPGNSGWSSRLDTAKPPITGFPNISESIGVASKWSDAYKMYYDGFISTTDYFLPVLFMKNEKSFKDTDTILFDPANNSISLPMAYWDKNSSIKISYPDLASGRKIKIEGTLYNDGEWTIKEDLYSSIEIGLKGSEIRIVEKLIKEEVKAKDVAMSIADIKVYTKMGISPDNNLEVTFYSDIEFTTEYKLRVFFDVCDLVPLGDLRFYQCVPMFSLKSNFKQTVDIIEIINPTEIIIDKIRYDELIVGSYLEASYDINKLNHGEMPKKITRITHKRNHPDNTKWAIITTDSPIKTRTIMKGTTKYYQTNSFKEIQNYITTYKGINLNSFIMRRESMPNGKEERMLEILNVMSIGTGLYKGLSSPDALSYRYLIDSFGLGLHEKSKQVYADILGARMSSFGFINMPSAKDFRKSFNPRYIDRDGTLNYELIRVGGDQNYNPDFYYTLANGPGASYVAYFYPYLEIDDNGRKTLLPPASFISIQYMKKFYGNTIGIGDPVAGVEKGRIMDITDVEVDIAPEDVYTMNAMGVNTISFKRNIGFTIDMQNTAKLSPKSALSYINNREILIQLESELRDMLLRFQWQKNNEDVRGQIVFRADKICEKYKNQGYINDFKNIMNRDNNPPFIVQSNFGILDTFIEVTNTLATIVNRITILPGGALTSDGFNPNSLL